MEHDTYWLDSIEKIHCDIEKAKLLSIKYFIPKRTQTQHIKVLLAFWKKQIKFVVYRSMNYCKF